MPKKSKAPKRAGGEQPGPRRSKRDKKKALPATELAASTVKRCGQQGCPVCDAQPCNDCSGCRRATKNGWDPAKLCEVARIQRSKPCPNVAKPEHSDGRDPRHHDKSNALHMASSSMIAFADNPSEAAESQLEAMGALIDELEGRGADLQKWRFLGDTVARLERDWSVDEIISDDDRLEVLEVATRFRYRGNVGGLPTEAEHDEMGPLETYVVKRWMGYKDGWVYYTKDEGAETLETIHVTQSDASWNAFTSYIEGGTADAKRKGETFREFWARWSRYLKGEKKKASFTGAAKTFRQQLYRMKASSPQWASTPEAIAWLKARDCTYQCDQSLITTSGYWVLLSTQVLMSSCRGARKPRSWSAAGRAATSARTASCGACWRRTAWSTTPSSSSPRGTLGASSWRTTTSGSLATRRRATRRTRTWRSRRSTCSRASSRTAAARCGTEALVARNLLLCLLHRLVPRLVIN